MTVLSDSYLHEVLTRHVGGSGWHLSEPMGTMAQTRLARRGDHAVAVKLTDTPPMVMKRLSELGVTPPVVATGEYDGWRFLIQQVVDGPHPDHVWFATNLDRWAAMAHCYLNDRPLRDMLTQTPAFWRLTALDAIAMVDADPIRPRGPALRETLFHSALECWRQQASSVVDLPLRPVHPDPHMHNYVIAGGHPYLLDWEHIDLSDPLRDVGIQIWGFLPKRRWREFLRRVGLKPSDNVEIAIYWWAALKMLTNATFNDRRGDEEGAAFHADAFRVAVGRQAWVDDQ